jgi:hypothetical protein
MDAAQFGMTAVLKYHLWITAGITFKVNAYDDDQ